MDRQPKPGDSYVPLFESDIDEAKAEGLDLDTYTITEVDFEWEGNAPGNPNNGWGITAKGTDPAEDPVGFDCQWSERHKTWCYGLQ